ncbi:MAG: putative rRNA maturation factor [Verrucomicrobiota bacterium]|jgi:probable rRNA maturation factor
MMPPRSPSALPPPPTIHVRNLQRKIRVNVARLQSFAERALRLSLRETPRMGRPGGQPREVFVLLISDRRMAALHLQFLRTTGPTDVITFQHGEIFVSIPTARRNAARFGNSLLGEIQLCIVHGLLHLRGFDDRNEQQALSMRLKQARLWKASGTDFRDSHPTLK